MLHRVKEEEGSGGAGDPTSPVIVTQSRTDRSRSRSRFSPSHRLESELDRAGDGRYSL